MNELGLPPRRTLPSEVRERIRVAVNTDTTTDTVVPRATARARTKFAAAAVVALAAGAVIIVPSMMGTSANHGPDNGLISPEAAENLRGLTVQEMADKCLSPAQKASGVEAGASTRFSGGALLMFRNGRDFGGTCVYTRSEHTYLDDAADSTLNSDSPVPDVRWTTPPDSERPVVIGVFAVDVGSVRLHFATGEPMVLSVANRTFMSAPQGEQRVVTSVEVYGRDHALLYDGPLR